MALKKNFSANISGHGPIGNGTPFQGLLTPPEKEVYTQIVHKANACSASISSVRQGIREKGAS